MTYLTRATNRMFPLLLKNPPSTRNLMKAASIGCKTLTRLVKDPAFKDRVSKFSQMSAIDDFEDIVPDEVAPVAVAPVVMAPANAERKATNLTYFQYFLEEEWKLLKKANFSTLLVETICKETEALQQSASSWHGDLFKFFESIQNLCNKTCNLKLDLKTHKTVEERNLIRNRLLGIVYISAIATCIMSPVLDPFIFSNLNFPGTGMELIMALEAIASAGMGRLQRSSAIPQHLADREARRLFWRRAIVPIILLLCLIPGTIFTRIIFFSPPAKTSPTRATSLPFGNITVYFYQNPKGEFSGAFDRAQLNSKSGHVLTVQNISYPDPGKLILCAPATISQLPLSPPGLFTYINKCLPRSAQKSGSAGPNDLRFFEAVFLTSITIPNTGTLTITIKADDGWIVGIEPGTAANGTKLDSPTPGSDNIMVHPLKDPVKGNVSAREQYPAMGANNGFSDHNTDTITIHFTAAGTYLVEIDYTECCRGEMGLVITDNFAPSQS